MIGYSPRGMLRYVVGLVKFNFVRTTLYRQGAEEVVSAKTIVNVAVLTKFIHIFCPRFFVECEISIKHPTSSYSSSKSKSTMKMSMNGGRIVRFSLLNE